MENLFMLITSDVIQEGPTHWPRKHYDVILREWLWSDRPTLSLDISLTLTVEFKL